jgi:DNA-binding MarR family transcriptional regulator
MRQLYRELEQMTDAPISMHRALNAIGEHPGIQASQLATALGMQRPAVSQIVNGMVERGWIERVRPTSDQRAVQLFPTAVGHQVLRATAGRAVATLQRSVRSLEDGNLEHLAIALPALLSALPDRSTSGVDATAPESEKPSIPRRRRKAA